MSQSPTAAPDPSAPAPLGDGLTRDEYFAERKLLIEARQRSYQGAEQMIAGGSAGVLVLSITFLEKLVSTRTIVEPRSLVAGWILLIATLSFSLAAQYASAQGFDCELRALDARSNKEKVPTNRWATRNLVCSLLSAFLFIAGIIMLARFAYLNAPFQ